MLPLPHSTRRPAGYRSGHLVYILPKAGENPSCPDNGWSSSGIMGPVPQCRVRPFRPMVPVHLCSSKCIAWHKADDCFTAVPTWAPVSPHLVTCMPSLASSFTPTQGIHCIRPQSRLLSIDGLKMAGRYCSPRGSFLPLPFLSVCVFVGLSVCTCV